MAQSRAVIHPNLGLYFDRPAISMDPRMLQNGFNFRVKEGKLSNLNLGWDRFSSFTLNGAVTLINTFYIRGQDEKLIFGTPTDLYVYNPAAGGSVSFITPIYATGTASANGTAVTGIGTDWDPNVKAGDEISFGNANQTDPAATWFTIQSRNSDTSLTLTASAGIIAAGVYTIRKKFTGDINDQWVADTFVLAQPANEDEWWATNGVDVPVKWNGVTSQVQLQTALNFTCKYLKVYRNMMIFGNLVQGGAIKPNDIINSALNAPGDVSTGLSEQFKVHSGNDPIQSMLPIADALAIYSERTVTVAQFVGDPIVFTFRNAMNGVGLVAPKAVADYGDYHEFIGQDSYYRFDGATVREANIHVWREVIRRQDPARILRTYSHFDEEQGDLIWSMPSSLDPSSGSETAAPSIATTVHYLENVPEQFEQPHSQRSWPFTATGFYFRKEGITWDQLTLSWSSYNFRWNDQFFFASFPLNMGGDKDGKIYTISTSQNADGVALDSFVRLPRAATIDGRRRGLLKRIYPFVTTFTTPVQVVARFADHAMGAATITHTNSFDQTLPEGGHFTTPYRRGRFFELEFGSDGPGQPWELSGYDVDITDGGKR